MKSSLRSQLSWSHLLVLFLGMVLAGLLVWAAVERIYQETQRENLLAQARLVAAAVSGEPIDSGPLDIYSQTTNIMPGIHTRLLDQNGGVILGVPFPEGQDPLQVPIQEDPGFVPADQLLNRPEIQAALEGEAATAVRTLDLGDKARVVYAAAPVWNDAGEVISLVYLASPLPARGLPSRLSLQLVGAVAGGAILAGLAGLLLARRLARPLEDLDRAASAIKDGDLSQQVEVGAGIQEIDNLGQTFNEMSSSLQFSQQAQNAFIADVTHELRTPLTVIKGSVETLEDGALEDKDGRGGLLSSLGRETDRLIGLVNDLLTLTRADASALRLRIQSLDLAQLVRERVRLLDPLLIQKELKIELDGPAELLDGTLKTAGDPDRLSQVLDNILNNAIRYAPDGSQITIKLKDLDGMIECSVRDQGPGIPQEHLSFIFERFYRVDPSRDRTSGGTGLGLAIARALLEAQGGQISAASREGAWTSISIRLPTF